MATEKKKERKPRSRARQAQATTSPAERAERRVGQAEVPFRLPRRGPDMEDPTASSTAQVQGSEELAVVREAEDKYAQKKRLAIEARVAWYRDYCAAQKSNIHMEFTGEIRQEFIAALEQFGAVLTACDWVGMAQSTLYKRRKEDPTLAAEMDAALERYRLSIVAEVRRRAVEGWVEPVYQQGQLVGTKRVFSDKMLELLAKAKIPEFKPQVDVTSTNVNVNADGAAPEVAARLAALTREQRAALRTLLGPGPEPAETAVDQAAAEAEDLPEGDSSPAAEE